MKIIACIDDNGGMMFNHRRQSRDRTVIADIIETVNGSKLYIDGYSETLFADYKGSYTVDSDMLEIANHEDFCFIENKYLGQVAHKIDGIILYRWNRRYPSDFDFDLDLDSFGFSLISTSDFEGYSHDKITKEIFIK